MSEVNGMLCDRKKYKELVRSSRSSGDMKGEESGGSRHGRWRMGKPGVARRLHIRHFAIFPRQSQDVGISPTEWVIKLR